MSEPIRYKATSDCFFLKSPDFEYFYEAKPDEVFVKEADYARLKAEVDEYRKDVTASVDTLIDERSRLKAEVERLMDFCTRTIIPNEQLQEEVKHLRRELAEAQDNYHLVNEIIKGERNVHRTNTMMLKDQIDGLIIDNQLLGERVLAYQRLKQLNDISRPSNEA